MGVIQWRRGHFPATPAAEPGTTSDSGSHGIFEQVLPEQPAQSGRRHQRLHYTKDRDVLESLPGVEKSDACQQESSASGHLVDGTPSGRRAWMEQQTI